MATVASATPAADTVVKSLGTGLIDAAWLPAVSVAGVAVGGDLAGTLPNPTVTASRFATPGPIGSGTPSTIAGTTGVFSGVATALNHKRGTGSPEGVVTGVLGDFFQRTDGGTGTSFYLKESGSGNTGWVAVGAGGGGSGTVTSVSVTTANGVSGSVATATTTPAITLTLGAITPSSVASTGAVTGTNLRSGTGTPEGAVTAPIGTLFERTDGSTGTTLYIKESGAGNTGWVAVAAGGGGGSAPFADNTALVKNDSDNTKTGKMLCSSQSTGVDMVLDWGSQTADASLLVPAMAGANKTLVVLELAQTFTQAQTIERGQASQFNALVLKQSTSGQNAALVIESGSGVCGAAIQFRSAGNDRWQLYGGNASTWALYDYLGGYTVFSVATGAPGTGLFQLYTHLSIETAGMGIRIKEGSNAKMGTATLVGGTVVVSTTAVGANSRIQLTGQNLGTITVPAAYAVSARTAGTSFTILSSNALDTSSVAWVILDPA